jgi:hypothetical protein
VEGEFSELRVTEFSRSSPREFITKSSAPASVLTLCDERGGYPPLWKEVFNLSFGNRLASRFGKEKNLRRLMVLVGLLAAMMMLTASPGLAHQGGPHHGDKYWKNYYPNTYF